jgi:hypothetical protein
MSDNSGVPDLVPQCCWLGQQLLREVEIILQHAAALDHTPTCVAAFQRIVNLLAPFQVSGAPYRDALEVLARVSRAPISKSLVQGRSATEWAIGLGLFLSQQVERLHLNLNTSEGKDRFAKVWPDIRTNFMPNVKPEKDKIYLGTFHVYAPDSARVFVVWMPPKIPELHAASAEIAWEQAHATSGRAPQVEPEGRAQKSPREARQRRLRDKKAEARDKWIYEQCCKGTPHDKIAAWLKKLAPKRGWQIVSTKQRVQQIGNEYADAHGLNRPPPRRDS